MMAPGMRRIHVVVVAYSPYETASHIDFGTENNVAAAVDDGAIGNSSEN